MQQYGSLIMIGLLFVFFYFFMIRPQKKQQQQYQDLLNALEIGDYIITRGGIKGVITKIRDNDVKVRIASGVEIEMLKNGIFQLDPKHLDEDEEKPAKKEKDTSSEETQS